MKKQNVKHIFGVPGDYNLAFLDFIEADPDLKWIGNCNELNAAYAADGYARRTGFGVVVTTHGVGELSAINGIAGSYAENVPVLHIVGYPTTKILEAELPVHHSLAHGDKSNFLHCFDKITCSNSILSKANYVNKLLHTISKMLETKTPAVIALPCDLLDLDVSEQVMDVQFYQPQSITISNDLLANIKDKYLQAKNPVIILGSDVHSFSWNEKVQELIKKLNIPVAALFMGKAILNEQDEHYIGMYAGDLSYPNNVQEIVESSDCIISIGTRRTDFTTGGFSDKYAQLENNLVIKPDYVSIGKSFYKNIHIPSLLQHLTELLPTNNNYKLKSVIDNKIDLAKWNQDNFWPYVAQNIIQPDDVVAAEAGTSLFGLLWQKLPKNVSFISQILWGSIGYSLPAIFGAVLANPNSNGVLIIGDGSFLLTAQELSSMVRYNANITILLINNNGYTVERAIHGATQSYNDIPNWDYSAFARSVGVKHTAKIHSFTELENNIKLLSESGPKFIECFFDQFDAPELLQKIAQNTQKQNKG